MRGFYRHGISAGPQQDPRRRILPRPWVRRKSDRKQEIAPDRSVNYRRWSKTACGASNLRAGKTGIRHSASCRNASCFHPPAAHRTAVNRNLACSTLQEPDPNMRAPVPKTPLHPPRMLGIFRVLRVEQGHSAPPRSFLLVLLSPIRASELDVLENIDRRMFEVQEAAADGLWQLGNQRVHLIRKKGSFEHIG